MLVARGLTVWRGDRCLMRDLGLAVAPGAALMLRGPNGAGKTTLLRVLCGFTRPEAGEVLWDGRVLADGLRGIASYSGHQPALNLDLTVARNLAFYAQLPGNGTDWQTPARSLGVERCRDLEMRQLSAGQRRRAGLVRVMLGRQRAWLLDEPFTHLDRDARELVRQRIAAHLAAGGLAVIASHDEIELDGAPVATLRLGAG